MPETKTVDPAMVAKIVESYVAGNRIAPAELPILITTVHQSLADLGKPMKAPTVEPTVAISRSYGRNFVACLECGWRGQMLRRHLSVQHGQSPRDYRGKWGLKNTHPITAPGYSARRSGMAKEIGLGRTRETPDPVPEPTPPPRRRDRTRALSQPAS
jgi:predicted transcriptional regulator